MNYSKSFNKILLQANKRHLQLSRKEPSNAFDLNIRKKQSMLSLPSQILLKERTRKLSDIYKVLSSEKAALNSTSKSKKKFQLTPQKKKYPSPFKPFSNNIVKNDNKHKLILQRTNQSSSFINTKSNHNDSHHIDLQIKLRVLNDKLEQLLRLKSNQNFKNQFKSFISDNFEKQNLNNHKQVKKMDLLYQNLSRLYKCFQRNSLAQAHQIDQMSYKIKQLQEEMTSLNIQLKKSSIKQVLYERNIEKQKQLSKQLQKQLMSYRNKHKNTYASVGSNTLYAMTNNDKLQDQIFQREQVNQIGQNHDINQQLLNYKQRIKELDKQLLKFHKVYNIQKKNFKQLVDVLVFLKKQGVDIQNIYDNVLNGRIDGPSSQEDGKNMKRTIKQLRHQQKQIYAVAKNIKCNNSFDADNSIISSQEGLSFNYQQKSLQMQAYTLRRQYKCKKQLPVDMKNKLKLNLNEFYDDDVEDYQDEFQNDQEIEEIQADKIKALY